ncbi:NEP1-interacting protein-like 1 [Sesamum indicum]|uniref:NEP1-interacting protein-like 1 n=1 Tax=Sesamum indicum TaxID=4182 RepID=A0A6I9UBW4_SESIN|nr:NEP1-interacting protein-like 1 [Sesamum indicum]
MLICCRVTKMWASTISSWVCRELSGSQSGFLLGLLKKFAVALLTCVFALGGATVGVISGAIKGQTTETGLLRGFGVGAVAGAVTGVQLMELILNGEPFSKVALICSLVNGKIFMEWVSPAVLKAYQWQISTVETGLREISDIFEVNTMRGLSHETIQGLPTFEFSRAETALSCSDTCCTICLQDFKNGECTRLLPSCRHFFHLHCIDEWLTRQASCPICRKDV